MLHTMLAVAAVLGSLAAAPLAAQAEASRGGDEPATWRIDTSHSELTFHIRHMLSRVRGSFGEWGGTITVDPSDLTAGAVAVDIQSGTIDTNNENRDDDLRGEEFFDSESHPVITFRSSSVEQVGNGRIRVHGRLSMRGVTRPVTLEGEYVGRMRDARGRERIGFQAETTIDRHAYGITWNRLVEGGNLLGDEVTIVIAVQAVRP